MTGYRFLNHPADWQPPAALADFLQAGPAPVYIGFGSMSNRKPEEVTALVVNALALAKQRGILMTGWGGLGDAYWPDAIFKIDSIPHDWLFPRVAAVTQARRARDCARAFHRSLRRFHSINFSGRGACTNWAWDASRFGASN